MSRKITRNDDGSLTDGHGHKYTDEYNTGVWSRHTASSLAESVAHAKKDLDDRSLMDFVQVIIHDNSAHAMSVSSTSRTFSPVDLVGFLKTVASIIMNKTGATDIVLAENPSDDDLRTYAEISLQASYLLLDLMIIVSTDRPELIERIRDIMDDIDADELLVNGVLAKAMKMMEQRQDPVNKHIAEQLDDQRDFKDAWEDVLND